MNQSTSNLHLDVLDKERQGVFQKLSEVTSHGILGGGTAIAMQIQHRESYDFDIFLKEPIEEGFLRKVESVFKIEERLIDNQDELSVIVKPHIALTFIFYPFKHLHKTIKTDSISLFDLKDLAYNKAYTIGRRPEYKVYVDLFFIFSNEMLTLEELLLKTRKKFKTLFNPKLFLEQLVFFKDLKDFKIDFISKTYTPEEIKNYFKKETKRILSNRQTI